VWSPGSHPSRRTKSFILKQHLPPHGPLSQSQTDGARGTRCEAIFSLSKYPPGPQVRPNGGRRLCWRRRVGPVDVLAGQECTETTIGGAGQVSWPVYGAKVACALGQTGGSLLLSLLTVLYGELCRCKCMQERVAPCGLRWSGLLLIAALSALTVTCSSIPVTPCT
jgi:hypothetical protein